MCNMVKCKLKRKEIEKMVDVDAAERQLDECERCCFKKSVPDYKHKTYAVARHKYVELHWKRHAKIKY